MKTNSSFHAAGEVATQPAWGTGEQAAQPLNGSTSRFAMSESSLADLLQKAASQYPNRAAYKFIDYDTDPAGFTETVTWWQVHRRAMIVAEELWIYASSGDRVAILAPQGLEYIIAFMGVLQAGLIAVPLPVPQFGIHDERISSALRDSAPSIILTTSSVIDEVTTYAPHACAAQGQSAPIVVAVDALDLSSSRALDPTRFERPSTAYLQYTSGSTRAPAGVVLSHKNVITNCVQLMSDYIGDSEKVPSTPVSWLPFYHDMGLMLGIILPMINQDTAVLMSPMAFLQRPARWMQLLAKHRAQISSAPNFGFELAVRRTSDDDMAGLDLGHVRTIVTGAERVNVATLRRFTERFAPFNLSETAIRPSYGLAEATVYVATAGPGRAPKSVCFDYQQLSVGQAKRAENGSEGANLVSYGAPRASTVRIVDPETRMENPAGTVGEIWVQGDNVGLGYWRNPQQTEATFRARLVTPSPGTSEGPWLRTGDLGVIFEGELFITGRIKELLVVDGANHYPEDIEATIQEITGGRVVAIAVPDDRTEKRKVRRSASVERYLHHEFSRLDAMA